MSLVDNFRLDQEILLNAANRVQRLKMFPYFDIAHYVLVVCQFMVEMIKYRSALSCFKMTIAVRDDLASGAAIFSRKHPLSCWLSSMLMCFAGSFLANFLLGEPVIAPFKRHDDILVATAVWYLVFYSPFDIVYKASKLLPVKVVLCVLKEVQRAYKVAHGVSHSAKLYPNSYLVHVLVGTAKGAGSGILKTFEQLVRGVWMPGHNEVLRPSFATKACLVASIVFTLDKHSHYITAPHDIVYLGVVGFFVYFKLSAVLLNVQDPFAPFENLFCAVFMGGIWDAMSRAITASRERRAGSQKVENGPIQAEPKKEQ
uniref:Trimeric intracellular cation channel type B n=1 Tax=Ascaris lumbricoides TaxID=6252 RepID=A0A0M3HUP5_ASCLU